MDKKEKYQWALKQIRAQVTRHTDVIAILANTSAILHQKMGFFWVGFYQLKNNELVLGPFQGTPACVKLQLGKGVCGTSALERKAILVPDVHEFPGHVACDPNSKAEIVVPMFDPAGNLFGVLDVDSDQLYGLDETDLNYLKKVADLLSNALDKELNRFSIK